MNRDTFIQDEIRNIARAKKQTKSKVTHWDMATMLISLHNVIIHCKDSAVSLL